MAQLPPTLVNPRHGEIQEYLDPAYEVADRGVCELLSAWGLIWCDQVTPRGTPELAAAFRKAYEAPDRRPWVTGAVGSWQGAFPANTFARLGDDRTQKPNTMLRRIQKLLGLLSLAALYLSPARALAGEAELKLPPLDTVNFPSLAGASGYTLMLLGIVICCLAAVFGVWQYVRTKDLPVHDSMRNVSNVI